MTAQKDLKKIIRARQQKTGESYTTARAHVLRDRAQPRAPEAPAYSELASARVEAVVLKVNQRSARVRILGEPSHVTFRSGDVWDVISGHVVTLVIDRRWTWREDAYASGKIENARIDVTKMGLVPLPLKGGELVDVAEDFERPSPREPGYDVWMKMAAKPRPAYEFDPIAWGAFPGSDPEENLTCDAAELMEAGDDEGARELLMDALIVDLRCIDAHCHLGNLEFDRSPDRAMRHYEMGLRIGEASLPKGYDGLLLWSIYNRPYLRCLYNYGLCLWRLGRFEEARRVFERNVAFNPNDNQGARFCLEDVRRGTAWKTDRALEPSNDLADDDGSDAIEADPELDAPHKIWIEQCTAALEIQERFGLDRALDYIVGEKLMKFVEVAEDHPAFSDELIHFVDWIKGNFSSAELSAYVESKGARAKKAGTVVLDRAHRDLLQLLLLDRGAMN